MPVLYPIPLACLQHRVTLQFFCFPLLLTRAHYRFTSGARHNSIVREQLAWSGAC
jgi:hypothetical protein